MTPALISWSDGPASVEFVTSAQWDRSFDNDAAHAPRSLRPGWTVVNVNNDWTTVFKNDGAA
ncbi:hypothetical protein [Solirubrobacter ginsenosidimutans]|uniref:hypothetical protein n=1 Tax=Solirubrobacter ginsenosidimutans TaxID=490573 RepID=UPI0022CDFDBF|nr:hypothetical protein [Solirubrobacter ginsenosidimutans]